ncbi:MAG: metallophosphoesterase [Gemmatimonadota bacterium]
MKVRTRWAAAAIAAAVLAYYMVFVEPRWLQLRRRTIHVRGLPREVEGFRIGLLTDFHAGRPSDFRLIRRAVAMLMAEQPDLIALTGDFAADDAADFRDVLTALEELQAPHGVYAVPGNHDYIVGIETWRRDFAAYPHIVDLTNRAVLLALNGVRVCVAGVDDFYAGTPRLLLPPPAVRDFTLLLAHSPDQAERCRRVADSVDLIVSGHTHAGQVRLPFIGGPLSSAQHADLYDEGLRRRPWTQVYVSRGIGTVHLPVRLLARPEIALLALTGARRPPVRRRAAWY